MVFHSMHITYLSELCCQELVVTFALSRTFTFVIKSLESMSGMEHRQRWWNLLGLSIYTWVYTSPPTEVDYLIRERLSPQIPQTRWINYKFLYRPVVRLLMFYYNRIFLIPNYIYIALFMQCPANNSCTVCCNKKNTIIIRKYYYCSAITVIWRKCQGHCHHCNLVTILPLLSITMQL